MTETISEERATTKSDQWRERLAAQKRGGLSVKQFCKEQGLTEYSFYAWRKRLRGEGPVRFALVDRGALQTRVGDGGQSGTGTGDRRAAAHRRRSGGWDLTHRAGRIARMIHLPGQRAGVPVPDGLRHAQEL